MKSTPRQVVVFRHVHFEDIGSLGTPLDAHGAVLRYIDAPVQAIDREAVRRADLVIVLGGPVGVYDEPSYPWITAELHAIGERLESGLPLLGICLGSQLIARALGARVFAGPQREIGWHPLMLTGEGRSSVVASLGSGAPMFHWHGDTFDLPQGATRLASSSLYENQVYRWGASTLAFQCHPEFEGGRVEEWLVGHAAELAHARIDVSALRRETALYAASLAAASDLAWRDWLAELGWGELPGSMAPGSCRGHAGTR